MFMPKCDATVFIGDSPSSKAYIACYPVISDLAVVR